MIRKLALYGPLDPSFVGGIRSWIESFLRPYCESRNIGLRVIHTGTRPFRLREDGFRDSGRDWRQLPGLPLPVYGGRVPSPKRLERELQDVDLVYFDNGYALQDVAVLTAARRSRVPVISGFHSVIRSGNILHDAVWTAIGSSAVRRFDAVHALNAEDASYLTALGARNVMTIPLAVDTAMFVPRPLPKNFTVTFLGRLHPQKGIDRLVDVVSRLHAGLPEDVEFTIAGDGPLRTRLASLNALRRVTNLGSVDRERAAALLGESSVVLMPSRYETFGYVAAEAMSAGALTVASDISGLRDVLEGHGVLISLDEPTAIWVDAVQQAYLRWRHERDVFELERAARHARAVARFGFDATASLFDDLLQRAYQG